MATTKFTTTHVNAMKRSIAEEYDKFGTAEGLRECYEMHIRNYAGRFDPHKLAAWGRSNLELYKQLTDNDRPNFEPYKSETMNVYKELDRIKDYELRQLAKRLEAAESKSITFSEDDGGELPVVTCCAGSDCVPYLMRVNRVEMPYPDTITVYGIEGHCSADDIAVGGLTEILTLINA